MGKDSSAENLEGYEELQAEFMKSQAFRDMVDASGIVKQTYGRGLADALLWQLTHRFGEVPESIVGTVRAADSVQLRRWLERVPDAPNLTSVFAEDE